jgi:hypothetical protein
MEPSKLKQWLVTILLPAVMLFVGTLYVSLRSNQPTTNGTTMNPPDSIYAVTYYQETVDGRWAFLVVPGAIKKVDFAKQNVDFSATTELPFLVVSTNKIVIMGGLQPRFVGITNGIISGYDPFTAQ